MYVCMYMYESVLHVVYSGILLTHNKRESRLCMFAD